MKNVERYKKEKTCQTEIDTNGHIQRQVVVWGIKKMQVKDKQDMEDRIKCFKDRFLNKEMKNFYQELEKNKWKL